MPARSPIAAWWLAIAPAALLGLFAACCGTFQAPIDARRVVLGHAALLAFAALGAGAWRDPLRLGRHGRWLPPAALALFTASAALSPVPRAGVAGLLLAPALLLVPAAVARCWADPWRRRRGLPAVSAVVGLVAAWSLLAHWRLGGATAMPLGHHNLLAAWLAAGLPLAALAARGPARGPRALALAASLLALVALVATGSLAGAVALAAAAALALAGAVRRRHRGPALAAAGLIAALAATQMPRLAAIAGRLDASTSARAGYLEAGMRGLAARPLLGWGPGATAWTAAAHMTPRPGVHPAGEAVADLHALPLQLAYEGGLLGTAALAALAACFIARRHRQSADPGLRAATAAAAAAWLVAGLGGLPLTVLALPVLVAVIAGAALAAEPAVVSTPEPCWPGLAGLALCALLLAPLDTAQLAYGGAARAAHPDDQRRLLLRARAFDPWHPLYRARLAWLDGDAAAAHRAAADARGVAALWLAAGLLADRPPAVSARLTRACDLDPLGPIAPFFLAAAADHPARAAELAARALLAEPRLLAATAWPAPLRRAAVARLVGLEGVEAGWRDALGRRWAAAGGRADDGAERRQLASSVDREPALAVSLHTFRRPPWPLRLATVELDAERLAAFDLGAATALRTTSRALFAPGCRLGADSPPP